MEVQEPSYENKRAYARRTSDRCISEVEGQNFPVEDWSLGGMRLFGDFRTYTIGQEIPVTLKFKVRDQITKVQHAARVVRRSAENMGLQFVPLTQDVRTNLQQVIDDYNAREFANSQA
ncbi:MAG: PilZ domain-containing protein [Pseudobdellovibrionaceae bacterium]